MKLIFFIIISVCAVTTFGQSRGYAGYIRIGTMNVAGAKSALSNVVPAITGFTSNFSGIGGELEYRVNRIVYDAELMILSQGPANSGDSFAEPFTGDLMFKAGYAILNTRSIVLYPNAGLGLSYTLVNTYQKSGGVKQQLHSIYLVQPLADLGLTTNVIVYRFKDDLPTGILPIGVRVGYRFGFSSDNWHRVDDVSTFKADYPIRGWYLSLALGMGYLTANKKNHK